MWKSLIKYNSLLLLIILLTATTRESDRISIIAKVDKKNVETGEVFTYTLEIKGTFRNPKIKPPDFKDFKVVAQSQSQQYYYQNNQLRVSYRLKYKLMATNPGTFIIKQAVIEDENKKYQSDEITINVRGKPLKEKKKIAPYIGGGIEI